MTKAEVIVGDRDYWADVLAAGRANPRLDILAAAPDAPTRLARIQSGLTVEQVVGMANALFNDCDPTDLEASDPGDPNRQSVLAWGFLERAKRDPRLGGKWKDTVFVLRSGSDMGLARMTTLDLVAFTNALSRVHSQVYRKV